jgi:hypothetical protein
MRSLLSALLVMAPALANASFDAPMPGEIALRDMPGTDSKWQEARSIVDAPPDAVRRWLTEFEYWPARFHDVVATRVLARQAGRVRIWMRSAIIGRGIVLSVRVTPAGIFYEGRDGDVTALGRIFITATSDGRTDVRMQSAAHLGGLLGVLAPKSLIRDRSREKLAADLGDLHRLAHAHHEREAAPGREEAPPRVYTPE